MEELKDGQEQQKKETKEQTEQTGQERQEKRCKFCNQIIEENSKRRLYCSKKCIDKDNYAKNRERYKANARRWDFNNPEKVKVMRKKALDKFRTTKRERFNELMRRVRLRNLNKWKSRETVRRILKQKRKRPNIERKCFLCETDDPSAKVRLKFEVYPTKAKEVRKAIEEKKIYFICKSCLSENPLNPLVNNQEINNDNSGVNNEN